MSLPCKFTAWEEQHISDYIGCVSESYTTKTNKTAVTVYWKIQQLSKQTHAHLNSVCAKLLQRQLGLAQHEQMISRHKQFLQYRPQVFCDVTTCCTLKMEAAQSSEMYQHCVTFQRTRIFIGVTVINWNLAILPVFLPSTLLIPLLHYLPLTAQIYNSE